MASRWGHGASEWVRNESDWDDHTHALLRSVFDSSPEAIVVSDPQDRIRSFNPAFQRLFGYAADDLLGRETRILYADQADYDRVTAGYTGQRQVGGPSGRSYVVRFRSHLDRMFHGETMTDVLYDAGGHELGYVAFIRDVSERIRAEGEYRAIFDNVAEGLCRTTPDGRIVRANRALTRLLGFDSKEDLFGSITDIGRQCYADQQDRARVMERLERDDRVKDMIVALRQPGTGALIWARLNMHAVRGEGGELMYCDASVENITGQKHAEDELRKFKQTLDQTLDSVFMFDADKLRFNYVNAGAITMTGYTQEELLGLRPYDLQPEYSAADFEALIAPLRDGRQRTLSYETLQQGKSGQPTPVEIFLQYVTDESDRFVAIVRDITERQRVLADLVRYRDHLEELVDTRTRQAEEYNRRNEHIIEAAMDGFFCTDLQGRILDCNEAFCEMLGYSRDEALQLSVADIEAAESADEVTEHIEWIRQQGGDKFDSVHRRKNGSTVHVEVQVTMGEGDEGERCFAFVHDITARKRSEAEILRRREEAEQANSAKSEFLSRMSHELRTPLNAVLGFAQLLASDLDGSLDDNQRANVSEIVEAGNHLVQLVDEVLDLSRIESGHLQVSMDRVALEPLIDSCVAQLRMRAERGGITLDVERSRAIPAVRADVTRLRQVLLNLLSNAVKYNRECGSVRLVCGYTPDGMVRISVNDTGSGIPPNEISRVFQPFERLESSHSSIEGAGIGLALCRRLVEAMGGTIGVDSVVDVGSTFWFELEAAECASAEQALPDAPAPSAEAPPVPSTSDRTYRLLYVEDNPANVRLLQRFVRRHPDLHCVVAWDAETGLECARAEPPDLILLDITLPGMSGFDVLRELKSEPRMRDIPMVAVSANAMATDIEQGMALGFTEYLTKPLLVDQFDDLVARLLRQPGATRA